MNNRVLGSTRSARPRVHLQLISIYTSFVLLSIILKLRLPSLLTFIRPHPSVYQFSPQLLPSRPPQKPKIRTLARSATARRRLSKTQFPASSEIQLPRSAPIRVHNFKGYKTLTRPAKMHEPINGKSTFTADVSGSSELPTPPRLPGTLVAGPLARAQAPVVLSKQLWVS